MRVCFCTNMAVVAVENPLLGEARVIREQHHCGKVGFLCALLNKPINLFRRRKSLRPSGASNFCRWKEWRSCSRTTFHTIRRSTPNASPQRVCLWRETSQSAAERTSSSTAACEIIVLALCCYCSLKMYQIPVGDGRQKRTYDNLDTHCAENAREKSSALPCLCHTLNRKPSECRLVRYR